MSTDIKRKRISVDPDLLREAVLAVREFPGDSNRVAVSPALHDLIDTIAQKIVREVGTDNVAFSGVLFAFMVGAGCVTRSRKVRKMAIRGIC